MGFWPIVIKVIRESDILLGVQDVRLPEISQNEALEKILRANGKLFVRVFTKIDLVSEKFLEHVKSNYKDAFFVSGTKNIGISELKIQLLIMAKRAKIENPRIGVVGYPNLGKSAIINALTKREIGRKRGMLLKGGIVDENRVSVMIIKDWQNGKIKL